MALGRIDTSIPWAKMKVVEALAAPYSTREEANRKIEEFKKTAMGGMGGMGGGGGM